MNLDLEDKLSITVDDLVSQRIAVLGASGMGKSNTVALLLENLIPQWPFVIFDIHDEYWGLLEHFPMLRVGKPCPYGDDKSPAIQLETGPDEAAKIADLSYDKRLSVQVNMLYMNPDERLEFVHNYCARIWQRNMVARQPYGVVLEEAQNFIPQLGNGEALLMMKRFALEGRKFGFTVLISSQRSSEINKTVLAMCGVAFLHGVDIYNDVVAYQGMLPWTLGETKKIALSLSVGEAIVKWKRGGVKFREIATIRPRQTLHVGDTPGLESREAVSLKPIDSALIDAVRAQLQGAADEPVDETTREIQRLKELVAKLEADNRVLVQQLAAQPVAVQQTFLGESEQVEMVRVEERTTTTYRSSRAINLAVQRQEFAFGKLLERVKALSPAYRRVLAYFMEDETRIVEAAVVARAWDYQVNTVQHAFTKLVNMGLVMRVTTGKYRAWVSERIKTEFADLVPEDLTKQILDVLAERP